MTDIRELINKVLPQNERCRYLSNYIEKFNNEYNMSAINFLIKADTTCNIELVGKSVPRWGEQAVNTYQVTLVNSKSKYTYTFYDSIYNTTNNKKITYDFYSALACLNTYCHDNFDDFCSDYGYEFKNERDYIKVKQVHLEVLDQNKQLCKLFTSEQLEELNNIN